MLSRVNLILPVALVLLASGQSALADFKYGGSTELFSTAEAACTAYAKFINPTYQFRNMKTSSSGSYPGRYYCEYQFMNPNKPGDWFTSGSSFVSEAQGCATGTSTSFKGAISTAIFSVKENKFFVVGTSPASGCYNGCLYESKGSNTDSCYLLSGSKTQGYCNYSLVNSGQLCSSTTLTSADTSGDSLVSPTITPGTGQPGTVEPSVDSGNPGTGDPGVAPGKPGTGGPGVAPDKSGTSEQGVDPDKPATGGPSVNPGKPGTGGKDGDSGKPGAGDLREPCKGDDFGSENCPEYKLAQGLNTANADITKGVDEAQKGVEDVVSKTQTDTDNVLQESERSVMQRFNTFLPVPSACVNPVVNFSWVSVPIEVCRFTFVKTLLTWLFSVATFIYVFRVMTSLGSTSEV